MSIGSFFPAGLFKERRKVTPRMAPARSLNGRCERVWEEGPEDLDLRAWVKGFQRLGARKVLRPSDEKQSPKPKKPEGMRI